MVHLIDMKRVPLLHNTVLILCDEGDGLVAVIESTMVELHLKDNECGDTWFVFL